MKRNIFLKAYLKNKTSPYYWEFHERMLREHRRPFIRAGKIDFELIEDFKPIEGQIKKHIFIDNGE